MSAHAIVLAAGAGRRFGGGKLLASWNGRPLIAWSVEAAKASGVDAVTVVLGADAEKITAYLGEDVRIVRCHDWEEGMAASLRCGIQSLPDGAEAALIFLADMPDVSPALGRTLLEKVLSGAPAALATYDRAPAHPAAVGASAFPLLASLHGDRGGRDVLAALHGAVQIVTDWPGSTFDIDRPDDLSRQR
ncbi:nucleotidyltransferase family protein [Sphingomonas sp. LY29]|uniref:nucleotidyltransferase family protein n=1 Tax=Sphingomonas sp. LY29 TaxID=3095341 RepID=UPI002D77E11B|nr:nucleotidyltransferase family protein [Sphingomonas sp. LY29]WRP25054.1 nucleotidyltransferase family protein [Sphingomonas sp. LY29]